MIGSGNSKLLEDIIIFLKIVHKVIKIKLEIFKTMMNNLVL